MEPQTGLRVTFIPWISRLLSFSPLILLLTSAHGSAQYGQYAPVPQSSYGQPGYAQPNYPQPGYAQPGYPQPQPYSQQQQYAQPAYPGPDQGYAQQQPYQQQQQYTQPGYANPGDAADPGQGYPQSGYDQSQPPTQPLTAEQLQELVAPIALYPDTLLAQVLAAATYPAQVVSADHWLQGMQAQGYAAPDQIAAGANAQSWDPSVKALTAFPQVLAQMDRNLQWTTDLGNAYYNQPQDVLQTVQVMRQRAEAAGTLENTPQESVTNDQGYIELAPPNPQVVYVPSYNPWDVYGQPVPPYPGFSLLGALASFAGVFPLRFGPGIAMAAFNYTPFGWLGWGLDWLGHSILFHHATYYSHSTSVAHWGSTRGGMRAGLARAPTPQFQRGSSRPQSNQGSYARPGNAFNSYNGAARQDEFARQQAMRSQQSYAANRAYAGNSYAEGTGRYASPQTGYARPGQSYQGGYQNYAYNRPQMAMPARPAQSYASPAARPGYGSSYYGGTAYAARPNPYSERAYAAPSSRGYSDRSESFRGYGGGFSGGRGAEKSYKAPKSYGGGGGSKYSGGGGHGGGHHR